MATLARAKSLAAFHDAGFSPYELHGTDPSDIGSFPGALEAFVDVDAIENAMQGLPDIWDRKITSCMIAGEKVILYFSADKIAQDASGTLMLRALAKLVENYTNIYAYIHYDVTNVTYRIGQVLDDFDREEVRGMLVMGRSTDAFTADPNDAYFRMNGIPANFAVSPKPIPAAAAAVSARPSYDVFPYKNKKGKIVKKTAKPRNPWIIFRASRHAAVKAANPGYTTAHLSCFIKHEWTLMDARLKKLFYEMARQESLLHRQLYPDFRVTARKSDTIQRRRRPHRDPIHVTVAARADSWEVQQ